MVLICLISCSTRYQPESFFSGGFSEILTGKDSFIVSFRGNSYTSSNKVYAYAMRRAAELCIKNGYKGFVILAEQDKSHSTNEYDTRVYKLPNVDRYVQDPSWVESSKTVASTVTCPAITLKIRCSDSGLYNETWVDAAYFLANNPV